MNQATFALVVSSVSLNALAQLALRKTMLTLGPLPEKITGVPAFALSLSFNPWFVTGIVCYVVSMGVWMLVLGRTEVSAAYPLLSIGYVITAVIGYYYLGEDVNALRICGIAVICFGIVLIARSS